MKHKYSLKILAVLLVASLMPLCGRVLAQKPRERKSINKLTSHELSNYIHALDILRARSAVDEWDVNGYANWAD